MKLALAIWFFYIMGLGGLIGFLVSIGTDSEFWGILSGIAAAILTAAMLWFYHWRLANAIHEDDVYW
jgi:hypothetical protein